MLPAVLQAIVVPKLSSATTCSARAAAAPRWRRRRSNNIAPPSPSCPGSSGSAPSARYCRYVGIGAGDVGHGVVAEHQPLEHRLVDGAADLLLVGADRLEPRLADRRRDDLGVDGVEIGDTPGRVHLLAERHQHETERRELNRLVHDDSSQLAALEYRVRRRVAPRRRLRPRLFNGAQERVLNGLIGRAEPFLFLACQQQAPGLCPAWREQHV
jgi:hypothetical protein